MRPIKIDEEQFRALHSLGAPVFWAGIDPAMLACMSANNLQSWANEDSKKNVEDLVLCMRSRMHEHGAFYALVDSDG